MTKISIQQSQTTCRLLEVGRKRVILEDVAQQFEELTQTWERRLSAHDRAIAEILATIRALGRPRESGGGSIGLIRPNDV